MTDTPIIPGRELHGAELIRIDIDELTDRWDVVESTIRSHQRRRAVEAARRHRRLERARRLAEAVLGTAIAGYLVYLGAGGPAWPH